MCSISNLVFIIFEQCSEILECRKFILIHRNVILYKYQIHYDEPVILFILSQISQKLLV